MPITVCVCFYVLMNACVHTCPSDFDEDGQTVLVEKGGGWGGTPVDPLPLITPRKAKANVDAKLEHRWKMLQEKLIINVIVNGLWMLAKQQQQQQQ